ncbi:hypothetical protein LCGC14_0252290 [marine sediment metagenome]|uniref:Uncharacterized protein n=1 Tax=marine sediment metagenome TaxID=412755 RepID=A0A0F9UL31_9ZZZZ
MRPWLVVAVTLLMVTFLIALMYLGFMMLTAPRM